MKAESAENKFVFFYHEYDDYGCFSNWYNAEFEYAGRRYVSVEQYMMHQKVIMFHQNGLAEKILSTTDPSTIKKLGRTKFKEFDSYIWDNASYAIVKRGIRAKFQQNADILKCLLNTGNKLLAEAAPNDNKWGIGISADDEMRFDVQCWTGENLLGRILMDVREELRRNEGFKYVDARNKDFREWHMRPGELYLVPKYHDSVQAYTATLKIIGSDARKAFLYNCSFADWEEAMHINMGGGLPAIGFWEMKQDIYDLSKLV